MKQHLKPDSYGTPAPAYARPNSSCVWGIASHRQASEFGRAIAASSPFQTADTAPTRTETSLRIGHCTVRELHQRNRKIQSP
jgi:hypothetical protein